MPDKKPWIDDSTVPVEVTRAGDSETLQSPRTPGVSGTLEVPKTPRPSGGLEE